MSPNDAACASNSTEGLTKREYFAAMAMQGIVSANFPQGPMQDDRNDCAHYAVFIADALIMELSK